MLSGCDFDVYELPLPGGADVGDNPMTVTVEFENVLDLVPQSSVKVNDVTVGKVTSVEVKQADESDGDLGYVAEVEVEIRGDTELPANATATIRQTSLLGEKFVSLAAARDRRRRPRCSPTAPRSRSSAPARTPRSRRSSGALSLLLNGGGIDKLRTIATEVNAALEGREDSVKSLLTQVAVVHGPARRQQATTSSTPSSRSTGSPRASRQQQPKIDLALEELPSALLSIDRQRDDLVADAPGPRPTSATSASA